MFVESTVFEIMGGGGGGGAQPPFVEGVGTKYLRTGRVNVNLSNYNVHTHTNNTDNINNY